MGEARQLLMSTRTSLVIWAMAFVVVGAAIVSPAGFAQRRFAGQAPFGVPHGRGFEHHGGRHAGVAYLPYFYPDYYDYGPDIVEPPPQTIVVQAPQPASQAVAPPEPAEPLVIELRGDRWVRISGYGEQQAGEPARMGEPGQAAVLPAAVLVFRDGHQEEIGKYVIVGSTIYARADYWTSGAWTRKVEIADLDVPSTLKVNQQRGARFRLPSSPIEVIMRP